jgi:cobalamin biosynthesis Co2+ chelatase CbiK
MSQDTFIKDLKSNAYNENKFYHGLCIAHNLKSIILEEIKDALYRETKNFLYFQ